MFRNPAFGVQRGDNRTTAVGGVSGMLISMPKVHHLAGSRAGGAV
jgi:hypothetical protein